MLRDFLRLQGIEVGRRHVGTLMRRMGIQALDRKPNTSKKHPAHPVFPYALRGLAIERANQVWALDITPTSRWRAAGCTWWQCWTGTAAGCWRIECRSRWRRT